MSKRADKKNIFLRLDDRHALSFDDAQWILMYRRGTQWRGISFIASHKGILRRVLEEAGCHPTAKAEIALSTMPHRFLDWLAAEKAKRRAA